MPTSERSEPAAVALKYERLRETAPKITASGRGPVAEQILALAFANGVPVREDPDLTEILAELDIDTVIPVTAFAAIAEILAYLYRLNQSLPLEEETP